MPSEPGIVIVDTSCLRNLEAAAALNSFRANLKAADLVPCATEVNLVEVASASPDSVQERLLRVLKQVAGKQPLLEWPLKLLKKVGKAMLAGQNSIPILPSGKEWYLDDIEEVRAIRDRVLEFQKGVEAAFSELHARKREEIQRRMKERSIVDKFESTNEFLDTFWPTSHPRREFAEETWKALGLPEPAPLALIDREESWRLHLDAEGVAVYGRAITKVQPKKVQRFDLLQLSYLGGYARGIIVTADESFLRAAAAVLDGRYPNARAMHISELK